MQVWTPPLLQALLMMDKVHLPEADHAALLAHIPDIDKVTIAEILKIMR